MVRRPAGLPFPSLALKQRQRPAAAGREREERLAAGPMVAWSGKARCRA